MQPAAGEPEPKPDPGRRDVLLWAGLSFAGVGAGFAFWPLVAQLGPHAGSRPDTLEVDLTAITPGESRRYAWKALPIFVRHRTPEETRSARSVALAELADPEARVRGAPPKLEALDVNRTKPQHDHWLVTIGVCSYQGCIVRPPEPGPIADFRETYVCPCCASRYDASGRIRSGPAPRNLEVPPYRFETATRIVIG